VCAQAVIPFITVVKNVISSSWTLSIPKLRLGFVQSPIISEQWFWTLQSLGTTLEGEHWSSFLRTVNPYGFYTISTYGLSVYRCLLMGVQMMGKMETPWTRRHKNLSPQVYPVIWQHEDLNTSWNHWNIDKTLNQPVMILLWSYGFMPINVVFHNKHHNW
jgi:hypothetical protein